MLLFHPNGELSVPNLSSVLRAFLVLLNHVLEIFFRVYKYGLLFYFSCNHLHRGCTLCYTQVWQVITVDLRYAYSDSVILVLKKFIFGLCDECFIVVTFNEFLLVQYHIISLCQMLRFTYCNGLHIVWQVITCSFDGRFLNLPIKTLARILRHVGFFVLLLWDPFLFFFFSRCLIWIQFI